MFHHDKNNKNNETSNAATSTLLALCRGSSPDLDISSQILDAINDGANLNARDDRYENTPLHWCTWRGATGASCVLISNGADVNALNGRNETPLQSAEAHARKTGDSTHVDRIRATLMRNAHNQSGSNKSGSNKSGSNKSASGSPVDKYGPPDRQISGVPSEMQKVLIGKGGAVSRGIYQRTGCSVYQKGATAELRAPGGDAAVLDKGEQECYEILGQACSDGLGGSKLTPGSGVVDSDQMTICCPDIREIKARLVGGGGSFKKQIQNEYPGVRNYAVNDASPYKSAMVSMMGNARDLERARSLVYRQLGEALCTVPSTRSTPQPQPQPQPRHDERTTALMNMEMQALIEMCCNHGFGTPESLPKDKAALVALFLRPRDRAQKPAVCDPSLRGWAAKKE